MNKVHLSRTSLTQGQRFIGMTLIIIAMALLSYILAAYFLLFNTVKTDLPARLVFHYEPNPLTPKPSGKAVDSLTTRGHSSDTLHLRQIRNIEVVSRNPATASRHISGAEFYFNKHPRFFLWIFFLLALTTISCGLFLPLLNHLWEISRLLPQPLTWPIWVGNFMFTTVIVAVVYVVSMEDVHLLGSIELMQHFEVLLVEPTYIYWLQMPPALVAVLCIWALLLLGFRVTQLESGPEHASGSALCFRQIQERMNELLGILAVVVAVGFSTHHQCPRRSDGGDFSKKTRLCTFSRRSLCTCTA
ncbi:MAG: hypothetical protein HC880_04885 [Bacteroidia bacterium]|nr:hypothetical protein [Bacteroidia bacterium]